MPTVLRTGPYRLYFFSNESFEPPHVHVDRDRSTAKFWLYPVALASSWGFGSRELRRIEGLVVDNYRVIMEAWNEHFEH